MAEHYNFDDHDRRVKSGRKRKEVDVADGLAFGARDGVRLHKANLGGDAEEFLDAFLDALFALLEILDRVEQIRKGWEKK